MSKAKWPSKNSKPLPVALTRLVSWLCHTATQIFCTTCWWWVRFSVLTEYKLKRDPHIIRHWEWKLSQTTEGDRLWIEISDLIDDLKSS